MNIKNILLGFMSLMLIGATSADSYGRWYDGMPPEKYQTNDVVVPGPPQQNKRFMWSAC